MQGKALLLTGLTSEPRIPKIREEGDLPKVPEESYEQKSVHSVGLRCKYFSWGSSSVSWQLGEHWCPEGTRLWAGTAPP